MSFVLPDPFPPTWACEWEEDAYWGLAATLNLNGVKQTFRWIQPGTFLMGAPKREVDRSDDETQHQVTLTRGYWLADTACTQALWQAVMGDNPSEFKDDPANPVEQVSWDDVRTFLDSLNDMVPGLDAGLPSEAQWEYACRADTTTPFSFGKNITPDQVNYDGNHPYADGKKGQDRKRTVPVRSLPPNPWGLYEIHGNVFEWCADWYSEYLSGPQIDPSGPSEGVLRVLRGGSYFNGGQGCRAALRGWNGPGVHRGNFGFRLALGQRPDPAGQAAGSDASGGGTKLASKKGGKMR